MGQTNIGTVLIVMAESSTRILTQTKKNEQLSTSPGEWENITHLQLSTSPGEWENINTSTAIHITGRVGEH